MVIFENQNGLSLRVVSMRVLPLDPAAVILVYDADQLFEGELAGKISYATIASVLSDEQVIDLLSTPITDAERLRQDAELSASNDFRALPQWSTWTAQEASDYIQTNIWNGLTQAQVNSYIDTTLTGTTIAALRGQIIAVLKQTAAAVLSIRTILTVLAKAVIFLRNLAVR